MASKTNDSEDKLLEALKKSELAQVRYLLENGCSPNCRAGDERNTPAVTQAALCKANTNCLDYLLKCGAAVNARDKMGMTPAMHAASYGNVESLKVLNRHKADFNAVDNTGATALTKAAQWGKLSCLQYLLNKSPAIDKRNRLGITALMAAAKEDEEQSVQRLLDAGAKIDLVDIEGYSALMHALQRQAHSCANILLKRGASINLVANDRQTTVMTLALNASKDCGEYSFVEKLLLLGADMTVSRLDQDYLHSMIARNKQNIVRLMIMNSCPPFDRRCWEPWFRFSHHHMPISPLAVALLSGFYDTAKYLIMNKFFTKYDMTILSKDPEVRQKLEALPDDDRQSVAVLDCIRSGPLPLKDMSFVVISEHFNELVDKSQDKSRRRKLVEISGLPQPLQAQFLFQTKASKLCLRSWHDLSLEVSKKIEVCTCSSCGERGGFMFPQSG